MMDKFGDWLLEVHTTWFDELTSYDIVGYKIEYLISKGKKITIDTASLKSLEEINGYLDKEIERV